MTPSTPKATRPKLGSGGARVRRRTTSGPVTVTRKRSYSFRVSVGGSDLAPGRPIICDGCNALVTPQGTSRIDLLAVVIENSIYGLYCSRCGPEPLGPNMQLVPPEEVPPSAIENLMASLKRTGFRMGLEDSPSLSSRGT